MNYWNLHIATIENLLEILLQPLPLEVVQFEEPIFYSLPIFFIENNSFGWHRSFVHENLAEVEYCYSVVSVEGYYVADIVSANDYYPGGSLQPGRSFSSPSYRYGFNGMLKDDEVKGSGNSYDFGSRMYDSRLMRWLAIDPLAGKYTGLSPYNFVANNPIVFIDPDGKSIRPTNSKTKNTFDKAFKNIFESFPEIGKHIKYKVVGTNDENVEIMAFVYVPTIDSDDGETQLSYIKAKKIIKNSTDLSLKDQLVALAYLDALESDEVHEFQQPYNKESETDFGVFLKRPIDGDATETIMKEKSVSNEQANYELTGGDVGYKANPIPEERGLSLNSEIKSRLKKSTNLSGRASQDVINNAVLNSVGGSTFTKTTDKNGTAKSSGKYFIRYSLSSTNATPVTSDPIKKK